VGGVGWWWGGGWVEMGEDRCGGEGLVRGGRGGWEGGGAGGGVRGGPSHSAPGTQDSCLLSSLPFGKRKRDPL